MEKPSFEERLAALEATPSAAPFSLLRVVVDVDAETANDLVPPEDPACPLTGVRGHVGCNDHRGDGCRFWKPEEPPG